MNYSEFFEKVKMSHVKIEIEFMKEYRITTIGAVTGDIVELTDVTDDYRGIWLYGSNSTDGSEVEIQVPRVNCTQELPDGYFEFHLGRVRMATKSEMFLLDSWKMIESSLRDCGLENIEDYKEEYMRKNGHAELLKTVLPYKTGWLFDATEKAELIFKAKIL